jgi:sec-independent protein translocase protein TatA
MLGTLGTPEMIFIFLLALVLFGPKKLPELGRTVGKAITEFRRASSELKSTFDRELKNLEAEANLKDVRKDLQGSAYNYDYSSYEHTYDGSYAETYDGAVSSPITESASATLDAESTTALAIEGAPEGAIARGSALETAQASHEHYEHENGFAATEHAPAD